jgi:hypothetical protein
MLGEEKRIAFVQIARVECAIVGPGQHERREKREAAPIVGDALETSWDVASARKYALARVRRQRRRHDAEGIPHQRRERIGGGLTTHALPLETLEALFQEARIDTRIESLRLRSR